MVGRKKASKGADGGLLRVAERAGITRGVFGGSKGWAYLGTGLWTLRRVRKMGERRSEVLISETLGPGDRIIIANGRATVEQAESVDAQVEEPESREPLSRRARKAEKKRGDEAAAKGRRASTSA